MISNIRSQTPNNYSNNISFKAIPLRRYTTARNTFVDVLQLEKSDLPFIQRFCENITKYFKEHNITDEATKDIMKDSFNTARNILSSNDPIHRDTKILVGMSEENLHGILIGNMVKQDSNGRIHYSSRKNHSKNEREIDWFTTWNAKGVGKSLMCEFFKVMETYPFKKIFIRSEVPENSCAQYVYEHLGFKQCGKRGDWVKKNNNINIIDKDVVLENCDIIPMSISKTGARRTEQRISNNYKSEDLTHYSFPIDNYSNNQLLSFENVG